MFYSMIIKLFQYLTPEQKLSDHYLKNINGIPIYY